MCRRDWVKEPPMIIESASPTRAQAGATVAIEIGLNVTAEVDRPVVITGTASWRLLIRVPLPRRRERAGRPDHSLRRVMAPGFVNSCPADRAIAIEPLTLGSASSPEAITTGP